MIEVTFTESGKNLSLRLKGHAGYAEHGTDIVCASASILAHTLASIVYSLRDKLDENLIINLEGGDTTIACRCKDLATYKCISGAFKFAIVGYTHLAHNYPQYVRLIES